MTQDNDREAQIATFLEKLVKLTNREIEDCIVCEKHIVTMSKIGRCVYAYPCGCRLWQGVVPEAWKRKA
jgi:hypothetical protein